MHKFINYIIYIVLLGLLPGHISSETIFMGEPIANFGKLDLLKQNKSTSQDVRSIIGSPRGYGKVHHKPDLEIMDIWFYEYMQQDGSQINIQMLIVFIDENDFYRGHIAFAEDTFLKKK